MEMSSPNTQREETLKRFADGIENDNKEKFTVFLCGPSLKKEKTASTKKPALNEKPSVTLRKRIKRELTNKNFQVFLGEDDGLENLRKSYKFDAQRNELEFIKHSNCGAIILIADSVGSFCELGLFNWLFARPDNEYIDRNKIKFYVIADKKYENQESYFNDGPIFTLKNVGGSIWYYNFDNCSTKELIEDLETYRSIVPNPIKGDE